MMSIIKMEFYKLWCRRSFPILIIALLCINVCYSLYTNTISASIPSSSYQKLQDTLMDMPNDQRYTYIIEYEKTLEAFEFLNQLENLRLQHADEQIIFLKSQNPMLEEQYADAYKKRKLIYCTTWEQEHLLLQEIKKEFDILYHYPEYLTSIDKMKEELSSISIFQNIDRFSHKNIIKTASDYAPLTDIKLTFLTEKGISKALSSPISDLLLLIAIFSAIGYLILEEKEKSLFSIVRITPKGKQVTFISKIFVLCISIAFVTLIFFASNLILMQFLFHFGNLQRSIQSLASFTQSTLSCSVNNLFIFYFIIKCIALMSIASIVFLCALLCKRRFSYIAIPTILLVISYFFTQLIDANAPLQTLKYVNLYAIVQTAGIFQIYHNFNISQIPVSYQMVMLFFIFMTMVLSISLSFHIYYKRRLDMNARSIFSKQRTHIRMHLGCHECFKIFTLQKAGILCCCFLFLQIVSYSNKSIYIPQEEQFYIQYMNILEGPMNTDKETFLITEQQRFDDLHVQSETIDEQYAKKLLTKQQYEISHATISSQLLNEPIFQKVQEQADYIRQDSSRSFLSSYGYQVLLQNNRFTLLPGIILLVMLIYTFSNVFTFEYRHQVHRLLAITPNKQRILYYKLFILFLGTLLCYMIAYLPSILQVIHAYQLPLPQAPITSIQEYQSLPNWLHLGQALILVNMLRFLCFYMVTILISGIAIKTKQQVLSILIAYLIFLLPLLLSFMGVHIVDNFSLYSIITYLSSSDPSSFLLCIFMYTLLSIIAISFLNKHSFNNHHRKPKHVIRNKNNQKKRI